jgi:hypothetical protein
MERLSRGLRLAKESLTVVRSVPALVALVILGLVLAALIACPLSSELRWSAAGTSPPPSPGS